MKLTIVVIGCAILWGLLVDSASAQSKTYGKEIVDQIGAGETVVLNGTTVTGHVMTGKSVIAKGASIHGDVMAGQAVELRSGSLANKVMGRDITVDHATVSGSISAAQLLTLSHAVVKGNVNAMGVARIEDSTIEGKLTVRPEGLVLHNVTLNDVEIRAGKPVGGQIRLSGGALTQSDSGRLRIKLGERGTSTLNGYEASSNAGQVTLKTPEGQLFLNGKQQNEATYADYLATHPDAPELDAPGWPLDTPIPSSKAETSQPVTVRVTGKSVVKGEVKFVGMVGRLF